MTERLFIYGTLAPGRPNAHVMADIPGTWGPATLRGRLIEQGWGAARGYPGIVLDGADRVEGLVFSSDELTAHWRRLDDFEGPGYERVSVEVELTEGGTIEAWVYTLKEDS